MAIKGFTDTGIDRLILNGKGPDKNIAQAVISASIRRQISGAPFLSFSFDDTDRGLIRSRLVNQRSWINFDGLVFDLVAYRKSRNQLDLTFEDSSVRDLKKLKGPLIARPKTTTRTRFARRLVGEVKGLKFRGEEGSPNLKVLSVGKKEGYWKALDRLAQEVQWRRFVDEDTLYFGSDAWLAGLIDTLELSEDDHGIDSIDPEFDGGKRATTCSIACRAKIWGSRPGAPIKIKGLGDLAGSRVWIVESLSRSLFSEDMSVQLIRKTPDLPEPKPEKNRHDDRATGGASGSSRGGVSSQGFQWPIQGVLTAPFGDGRGHDGIDIDCETGDAIAASRDGHVLGTYSDPDGYGNYLDVGHEGGFSTRYAHLSAFLVRPGQSVKRGAHIARGGDTGRSTGSHLHFEIRLNGSPVDPLRYLP